LEREFWSHRSDSCFYKFGSGGSVIGWIRGFVGSGLWFLVVSSSSPHFSVLLVLAQGDASPITQVSSNQENGFSSKTQTRLPFSYSIAFRVKRCMHHGACFSLPLPPGFVKGNVCLGGLGAFWVDLPSAKTLFVNTLVLHKVGGHPLRVPITLSCTGVCFRFRLREFLPWSPFPGELKGSFPFAKRSPFDPQRVSL
jgi:hypothetical protein